MYPKSYDRYELLDVSIYISPAELDEAHAADTKKPRKVLLSSVRTAKSFFQGRIYGLDQGVKESIRDGIKNGKAIDPIVVFGSAEHPVVVDGHHRFEVFREKHGSDPSFKIDVQWIKGDFTDAQRVSFSANQATTKSLSTKDRMQHAWRTICLQAALGKLFNDDNYGNYTAKVKEHEQLFGVGNRSTKSIRGQMRRLLEHLGNDPKALQKELSNSLNGLSDAQWPGGVKYAVDRFILGENPSVELDDHEEDDQLTIMKERLFKAIYSEWRSNIHNAENLNTAYLSQLSNYAKKDLYEQLRWELDEDFMRDVDDEVEELRETERQDREREYEVLGF